MLKRLSEFIYSFCLIGYIPIGSGTVASAVAAILFYFLLPSGWSYWLVLAVLFALGVLTTRVALDETGKKDPHVVVIDEVVGMLVAVAYMPRIPIFYIIAFFVFRFFDIIKPFPIRRVEHLKGEWGVMLDDVIAGCYSIPVVWILFHIIRV